MVTKFFNGRTNFKNIEKNNDFLKTDEPNQIYCMTKILISLPSFKKIIDTCKDLSL